MSRVELLEFFKTNTRNLPDVTGRWYQLPTPWEVSSQPQLPPADSNTRKFLEDFSNTTRLLMSVGNEYEVLLYTTQLLESLSANTDAQLSVRRVGVLEARTAAQYRLFDSVGGRYFSTGGTLRNFYDLSRATDLMRYDLEFGTTSNINEVIDHFDASGMAQVGLKIIEKKLGRPWERPFEGRPVDLEIREMEKEILERLQS